jgi:hypothetical protein
MLCWPPSPQLRLLARMHCSGHAGREVKRNSYHLLKRPLPGVSDGRDAGTLAVGASDWRQTRPTARRRPTLGCADPLWQDRGSHPSHGQRPSSAHGQRPSSAHGQHRPMANIHPKARTVQLRQCALFIVETRGAAGQKGPHRAGGIVVSACLCRPPHGHISCALHSIAPNPSFPPPNISLLQMPLVHADYLTRLSIFLSLSLSLYLSPSHPPGP